MPDEISVVHTTFFHDYCGVIDHKTTHSKQLKINVYLEKIKQQNIRISLCSLFLWKMCGTTYLEENHEPTSFQHLHMFQSIF